MIHRSITLSAHDASDLEHAKLNLEMCLRDINVWMLHNNLQLNDDKTEILVFHAKHHPAHIWTVCKLLVQNLSPLNILRTLV